MISKLYFVDIVNFHFLAKDMIMW